MATQLVISMIFAICQDDTLMYRVQTYKTDCYEYYANCVVDNGNNEQAVKVCKDEAKSKQSK